jgi:tetratricopeptide (TPR) repeat protein
MKALSCTVLLTIALAASAQSLGPDIRVTGEYAATSDDTPDTAKQMALVAAERKAIGEAAAKFGNLPEVKALQLNAVQVDAYSIGALEPVSEAIGNSVQSNRTIYRIDAVIKVDEASVRRFTVLQKDRDATAELIRIRKEIESLHRQLETQPASATFVVERQKTLTLLHIKMLTARVAAALAKTEEGPSSRRISTKEGRERARAFADQAIALDSDSPDAHYALGDVLMELDKYDLADAEYRKALLVTKDSWRGHAKLANALRLEGKLPDAVAEFHEAFRIDPSVAQVHADLGLTLNTQKLATEAIAEYREAIRLDADSIDGHNGLAIVLASQRRIPAAVEEFKEIIRIDPELVVGHYNAAVALADMERDAESAAELREVVRINPNHYNAHYNLGELLRLEGKYDDAARQFREYLRLAPDTPAAQRNRQRAAQLVRDYEGPQ